MLKYIFILGFSWLVACSASVEKGVEVEIDDIAGVPIKKETVALVVHGGAGTILRENVSAEKEQEYLQFLDQLIQAGYEELEAGEDAQQVVVRIISKMEDNPLFNAGKGAVLTAREQVELDASIMHGGTLNAGAVTQLSTIQNPIQLAELVMDHSAHVMLAGSGAEMFASSFNLPVVPNDYFITEQRREQLKKLQEKLNDSTALASTFHDAAIGDDKFGTVGCVALDKEGNIVAGTSTGGMMNKMWGRIGDSPIIGAGTYANNKTCGISSTGWGEYFIRGVIAYDISALMEYRELSLAEASQQVIHEKLTKLGGDGGIIGLDKNGNVSMVFNTAGMFRASIDGKGIKTVEMFGQK